MSGCNAEQYLDVGVLHKKKLYSKRLNILNASKFQALRDEGNDPQEFLFSIADYGKGSTPAKGSQFIMLHSNLGQRSDRMQTFRDALHSKEKSLKRVFVVLEKETNECVHTTTKRERRRKALYESICVAATHISFPGSLLSEHISFK